MNKCAMALAGFGFAAGIVLIIVIEPLITTSGPKTALQSPQLAAATVAKPAIEDNPHPPDETFPEARRACTLKAAETLPRIGGLMIKQTRTKDMPPPAGWSGSPPIRVEVDIVAAGQTETVTYLCGDSPAGAVVQRLPN